MRKLLFVNWLKRWAKPIGIALAFAVVGVILGFVLPWNTPGVAFIDRPDKLAAAVYVTLVFGSFLASGFSLLGLKYAPLGYLLPLMGAMVLVLPKPWNLCLAVLYMAVYYLRRFMARKRKAEAAAQKGNKEEAAPVNETGGSK